jgi:hypothetical protein
LKVRAGAIFSEELEGDMEEEEELETEGAEATTGPRAIRGL